MRVYREFVVNENTRTVEVHWIDEATGREIGGFDQRTLVQVPALDWASLARQGALSQLATYQYSN